MALARIISRSHQCARELAFDLLTRGYTVEIVSPDAIPDNFADLELRVESGPDNALTATVETHTGARSSSLEFVHHLKAPMRDFIRRIPEAVEPVLPPAQSIPLHSETVVRQSAGDDVMAEQIVVDHSLTDVLSSEVELCDPIMLPPDLHESETKPAEALSADAMIDVREPKFGQKTKLIITSVFKTWHWRSGVAFAALLLVAVALSFSVRHQNYFASASDSKTAVSKDFAMTSTPITPPATVEPNLAVVAKPAAIAPSVSGSRKAERQRHLRSSKTTLPRKPDVTIAKRQYNGDVVAPNTVVYFDHRAAQSSPAKNVPHHAQRSTADGVIASTSAPDLSAKPAPKAAPQR